MVVDDDGEIKWANRSFAALVEREPSQLVGESFSPFISDTDPVSLVGLAGLLGNKSACCETSVTMQSASGSPLPVRLTAARAVSSGVGCILLVARALGAVQEELAASTRWAAYEQSRADELGRARDVIAQANRELKASQDKISRLSREAGIAEMASGVLHNVGNVINSVGVAAEVAKRELVGTNLNKLGLAGTQMLAELDQLDAAPPKMRKLAQYVIQASTRATAGLARAVNEIGELESRIVHVKSIVSAQQRHAKTGGLVQMEDLNDVVDEALKLHEVAFEKRGISVVREFGELEAFPLDRHKIVQILVNLLSNARHAIVDWGESQDPRIVVKTRLVDGTARIEITDQGVGIPADNLVKIFTHGFTTKPDGHGFGLHSSATLATELGGSLAAASDGHGRGSTFTIELPLTPPARLAAA